MNARYGILVQYTSGGCCARCPPPVGAAQDRWTVAISSSPHLRLRLFSADGTAAVAAAVFFARRFRRDNQAHNTLLDANHVNQLAPQTPAYPCLTGRRCVGRYVGVCTTPDHPPWSLCSLAKGASQCLSWPVHAGRPVHLFSLEGRRAGAHPGAQKAARRRGEAAARLAWHPLAGGCVARMSDTHVAYILVRCRNVKPPLIMTVQTVAQPEKAIRRQAVDAKFTAEK